MRCEAIVLSSRKESKKEGERQRCWRHSRCRGGGGCTRVPLFRELALFFNFAFSPWLVSTSLGFPAASFSFCFLSSFPHSFLCNPLHRFLFASLIFVLHFSIGFHLLLSLLLSLLLLFTSLSLSLPLFSHLYQWIWVRSSLWTCARKKKQRKNLYAACTSQLSVNRLHTDSFSIFSSSRKSREMSVPVSIEFFILKTTSLLRSNHCTCYSSGRLHS